MTEQIHTPNSDENVDQLTIYQKKFFSNHQFVGQIYGRNKWRVNEFITKLNMDSDSSTRIYWKNNKMQNNNEENFDYKPHWVVTSTKSEDVDKAVDWLIESELECWKSRALRRVTKENVFKTNGMSNNSENNEHRTEETHQTD